jgi:arginase
MRDVDRHGIGRVVEMALAAVDPHANSPLHLSLDIDAVDPHFAPGTGTMVRGGLTYREIHYICEEMALTKRLVGMDLVEVNPHLEPNHKPSARAMHNEDPNAAHVSPTVQLGVELVLSALGKTIMHDKTF